MSSNREINQNIVDKHNEYRAKHGCPPLIENPVLSQYSQQWANNLAIKNIFCHREEREYGENLAMLGSCNADPIQAVAMWYAEIQHYDYDNPGFSSSTGHFSQVIWKESRELGIGFAKSRNGALYVVCNYDPSGNVTTQFNENTVPQLL